MNKPFVEVHLTDILSREAFRHHSFFSDIALATVMGRGADSYVEGFVKLVQALKSQGHLSKIT
ncbi:MAG: 3-dehydroquinate dehydratase 1 [uncultured bacterium]|nr:MAG: 3-dehydroquinate dehydratase 1 [uncultured bacterium]